MTERDDQIAEALRVHAATINDAFAAARNAGIDAYGAAINAADATYHATLARINKDHPA